MKLMSSTVFKDIFLIPKFSVRICCTVYLYSFLSVTHAIFNLSKIFTVFTFASVFCAAHFLDQCVNLLDSPWNTCATQKALDFFQSFFLTSETWGCIRNKKYDIHIHRHHTYQFVILLLMLTTLWVLWTTLCFLYFVGLSQGLTDYEPRTHILFGSDESIEFLGYMRFQKYLYFIYILWRLKRK